LIRSRGVKRGTAAAPSGIEAAEEKLGFGARANVTVIMLFPLVVPPPPTTPEITCVLVTK